jgi:DnaJ-class molecular chaperone
MNADNAFNRGPVKAEPKLYDLNVSLEELYTGALKKIKVNRKVRFTMNLFFRY